MKQWKKLLIAIPFVVLALFTSFYSINFVMGKPSDIKPMEFVFLDYYTDGKKIFIWFKHPATTEPRTFAIPYSSQLHNRLEEARIRYRDGKKIIGTSKMGIIHLREE